MVGIAVGIADGVGEKSDVNPAVGCGIDICICY